MLHTEHTLALTLVCGARAVALQRVMIVLFFTGLVSELAKNPDATDAWGLKGAMPPAPYALTPLPACSLRGSLPLRTMLALSKGSEG